MARERADAGAKVAEELLRGNADIVGKDGHIDLVGPLTKSDKAEKNAEYEQEAARKKRELEDQYTMRFANAAGRDGFAAGDPWYASSSTRKRAPVPTSATKENDVGIEAPTKNVWGRDDPKRQDREVKRIASNDPLAMMKMGAKRVREIEQERKRENEDRKRELKELRELDRDERTREKRRRSERRDEDSQGHRHRSEGSKSSRRRHRGEDQEDRRHRHRDGRRRSHKREGDYDHVKHRPRDDPKPSLSYRDHETEREHGREHDAARRERET